MPIQPPVLNAPLVDPNTGMATLVHGQWLTEVARNVGTGGGGAVDSVFGRTGVVVAVTNDYTWAEIDKTVSDLADITTRSHGSLQNILGVDETDTDATKDKHVSNLLAKGWEDASLWETSGGNAQLITADDIDFQKFKAISMLCDNGATLPATPFRGQWFLHIPTGRTVLYQYDGSDWQTSAIISFGPMTVYVDATDGADDLDQGGAVDSGAFATVQFAVDTIPGLAGGIVTLNINNESYSESVVIQGKNFTGNYYLLVIGTMTNVLSEVTNADIFSSNTIGQTGSGWTVNAFQKKIVRITGGTGAGQRGIIESNTSDTISIKSSWLNSVSNIIDGNTGVTVDATSDFVVEDWGTDIDQSSGAGDCIATISAQQNIVVQEMKLINASSRSGFMVKDGAKGEVYACSGDGGRSFPSIGAGKQIIRMCVATGGIAGVWVQNGTLLDVAGLYIYDTTRGGRIDNNSKGTFYGVKIDNASNNGLEVQSGAQIITGFTAGTACQFLNNGGWGIIASAGGLCQKASDGNNTYSGNGSGTFTPVATIAGGTT